MAMTLRLPEDLQVEAAELAQYLGCSLNAVVIQALRGFVIFHNKQRPDLAGLQAMTAKAPNRTPISRTTRGRVATAPSPNPASGTPTNARSTAARIVDRPSSVNAPCPCGSGQKYKHCHGKA